MKKFYFFIIFLFSFTSANGANLNYFDKIDVSAQQKTQIEKIKKEEEIVLRPYILDISSKERGLKLLNSMKCSVRDFTCKENLQKDIEQRQSEYNELVRKINQKKRYYEIRYKNILTRSQILDIENIKQKEAQKEKVEFEREQKAKREQGIEKLKVWKKANIESGSQGEDGMMNPAATVEIPDIDIKKSTKGVPTGF